MKQYYFLAVAMAASCTMYAATPKFVGASAVSAEARQVVKELGFNPEKLVRVPDLPNSAQFKKEIAAGEAARKAKKSVAKAESDVTWKSLGDGSRMLNTILTTIGAYPEVIDIDLATSDDFDHDAYAINNPLKNSNYASSGVFSIDEDYQVVINTEDDEMAYIDVTPVFDFAGSYASYGTAYIFNIAGYYKQYYPNYVSDDMYGTVKRGVITFPAGTVYLYIGGGFYAIAEDFKVASPNKKLYYTMIEVENSCVGDDEAATAYVSIYGDVASAKVGLSVSYLEPNNQWYNYVAELSNADVVTKSGAQLSYKLSGYSLGEGLDIDEHCPFTVIVAGLDDNGNVGCGSVAQLYYQPEEDGKWKSIGTGSFTDGFLSDNFSSTSLFKADVEIQESTELSGYYRVVNPFKNLYTKYLDADHDHYLYLSAVEGEPIYVQFSSSGIDLGYGVNTVSSLSYYYYYMGIDVDDSVNGVWDKTTNTITFPEYSLLTGAPMYANGTLYQANYDGTFALQFPEGYTGVKTVTADDNNAPVEYFNLQGVRISEPTPGQLVIRRQGTTVSKSVVK